MTGIQEMADRLLADADAAGAVIRQEARQKADAIAARASADAEQKRQEAAAQTDTEAGAVLRSAHSAAELIRRNALLIRRRELIENAMQETVAYLTSLPDADYIALLQGLLTKVTQPGTGVLYLNAADRQRSGIGALTSATVTLAEETLPLRGGFVLRYDQLEMNCSFEALLQEKHEQLEDLLNRELFG